jgi:Rps23 Pro-64 3,4-dihydroxylase Tpa1-like proline 4-hydroxylase
MQPALGTGIAANSPGVDGIDYSRFEDGATLAERYAEADPFPHIVIDGRFPEALLRSVSAEIAGASIDPEQDFYGSFKKHRISDVRKMGPNTRRLIEDLNSAPFLRFVEELTGIDGLIPDPHLEGGGIHQIGRGGFLKVHTDFNWHRRLELHRRVNLLVYLNEGWSDDWNGHLEFWNDDVSACKARIAPLFNRMAVFSTTDRSYHGHPDPLDCPEGTTRASIAMYYYSATRPKHEIQFGASEMTNYRARPSEQFEGGAKHTVHQLQIKHPRLRQLLKRFGFR